MTQPACHAEAVSRDQLDMKDVLGCLMAEMTETGETDTSPEVMDPLPSLPREERLSEQGAYAQTWLQSCGEGAVGDRLVESLRAELADRREHSVK